MYINEFYNSEILILNFQFTSNLTNETCKLEKGCGSGGMLPYGFYGMIQGAGELINLL